MSVSDYAPEPLTPWESRQVRRLLDPEDGIYAVISALETRLLKWAVGILGLASADLIIQIVQLATRHSG